jgi:protocatechuate 3,4-dioxygenase beta subunit
VLFAFVSVTTAIVFAQGLGAGTVEVTVVDPNGAVVPNASVTISNPVTGFARTAVTGQDGVLRFDNVPPNNYQVSISATGFAPATQTVSVRTSVPIAYQNASECRRYR